ncbi:MAG: HAMP domain-containing histidine kinase [Anaerolineae bacterium]|nr:HAMP domain-containing histidine kinase [Anaerolineae bacterium]MDH7472975.1 HAMP domain-containing sensor histidine kinase [Anaerolineae bacterium]
MEVEEALRQRIEGMEQRISNLERLVRVSLMLNSTLSLEPLLETIIQVITELTDTEDCSILLFDEKTGELRFRAARRMRREELEHISVPLDNSIAGWIFRENKPLLIRDAQRDDRFYQAVDEKLNFRTRSIIGVPLQARGQVIGVLEAINKRGGKELSWEDVNIMTTLAAQAAIAIENARLMEELQKAYDKLHELDRLKSDFISIAAHELRTPLSLILGYASFLRTSATGQASEQLDIVLQSAMRLNSLIGDMVNLRHIQTGEVQLELETFSLNDLVRSCIQEFLSLASAKQQTMGVNLPSPPLMIEADRQKLHLVLGNLLSNAVKFTPAGGRIEVLVCEHDEKAWVCVRDTGIGIPRKEWERVFDRFYQVEPSLSRRYEGMGLGLSIAKGMVELHGGRIWVESEVGKGSNFIFHLPLSQTPHSGEEP